MKTSLLTTLSILDLFQQTTLVNSTFHHYLGKNPAIEIGARDDMQNILIIPYPSPAVNNQNH